MTEINFIADKVDVGSKKIDGTRKVLLEVGEYEHNKLSPILSIPEQTNIKVKLEWKDE